MQRLIFSAHNVRSKKEDSILSLSTLKHMPICFVAGYVNVIVSNYIIMLESSNFTSDK